MLCPRIKTRKQTWNAKRATTKRLPIFCKVPSRPSTDCRCRMQTYPRTSMTQPPTMLKETTHLGQANDATAAKSTSTIANTIIRTMPSMTLPVPLGIVGWMFSVPLPIVKSNAAVNPFEISLIANGKSPALTSVSLRLAIFELHARSTAKFYDQHSFALPTRISQGLAPSDHLSLPFFLFKLSRPLSDLIPSILFLRLYSPWVCIISYFSFEKSFLES